MKYYYLSFLELIKSGIQLVIPIRFVINLMGIEFYYVSTSEVIATRCAYRERLKRSGGLFLVAISSSSFSFLVQLFLPLIARKYQLHLLYYLLVSAFFLLLLMLYQLFLFLFQCLLPLFLQILAL